MLVLTTASLALFFWLKIQWLLQMAMGFAVVGVFFPSISGWIHRGWMLLAKGLGWFNGRVLLSLVFFVVITPVAFLTRSARAKSLFLKKKTEPDGGYFSERNHKFEPKDFENTF